MALFTSVTAVFMSSLSLVFSVNLVPSGNQRLCVGDSTSFSCSTNGSLLWETSSDLGGNHVFDNNAQPSAVLGIFLLEVEHVSKFGVISTATVSNVQASYNGTSLTCLKLSNMSAQSRAALIVGPPPPPIVTSITQSSTNSSSLLISWSMSDCAVQYVVTIINSSDGSVYLNITTSDTNTTVTLPTGVEYCVTVLGVDNINRTGPPSQQQCYPPASSPSSITSGLPTGTGTQKSPLLTTLLSTSTSPTADKQAVNAAAIAVPIVMMLLLVALVAIVAMITCVVLLLIKKKGRTNKTVKPRKTELPLDNKLSSTVTCIPLSSEKQEDTKDTNESGFVCSVTGPSSVPVCMCQVFYQKIDLNCWRIVFAFFPKVKFENVKQFYHDAELGSSVDELLFQDDQIEISYPKISWWTVTNTKLNVTTAAVEQYTGEGEPPYCEMTVGATQPKINPGDLNFQVSLFLGGKKTPVHIARMYEEPQYENEGLTYESKQLRNAENDLDRLSDETTNEPEIIHCLSCQVFYHKDELAHNCWKVAFAFCPRPYLDILKALELFQNANIGPRIDVEFIDEAVSVEYSPATITEGWEVIKQRKDCKIIRSAVEQYTGEGDPPYCEMTLRATDDQTSHNANVLVSLIGARTPNIIKLTRAIELSAIDSLEVHEPADENIDKVYVCQVFFKWKKINYWVATFSFFLKSNSKLQYYSSEEVGPSVDVQFKNDEVKLSADKVDGWICEPPIMKVSRAAVEQCTSGSRPPHCEMIIRAVDDNTPHNLTLPVTLTGLKRTTIITLVREAETSLTDILGKEQEETFDGTKYMCQAFYHKLEGNNHWKAILAFFPKDGQKSVNTVYQSEVTGPIAEFQFESKRGSNPSIKIGIKDKPKGWNVTIIPEHNKITRTAIDGYTGYRTDTPPQCEMILKAVSDSAPPPDLTVSLTLTGGRLLDPIILERKPEKSKQDNTEPQSKINEIPETTPEIEQEEDKATSDKLENEKDRGTGQGATSDKPEKEKDDKITTSGTGQDDDKQKKDEMPLNKKADQVDDNVAILQTVHLLR